MIVNNFYITEVKLLAYDPKSTEAKIRVSTSDNLDPIMLKTQLNKDVQVIAENLVKVVKQQRKPVADDDGGVLSGVSVVTILNGEEVAIQVYKGLVRLDSKLERLRGVRVASEYMRAFDQVKSTQEVLYRKGIVKSEAI
jgi:hypothetical protein